MLGLTRKIGQELFIGDTHVIKVKKSAQMIGFREFTFSIFEKKTGTVTLISLRPGQDHVLSRKDTRILFKKSPSANRCQLNIFAPDDVAILRAEAVQRTPKKVGAK